MAYCTLCSLHMICIFTFAYSVHRTLCAHCTLHTVHCALCRLHIVYAAWCCMVPIQLYHTFRARGYNADEFSAPRPGCFRHPKQLIWADATQVLERNPWLDYYSVGHIYQNCIDFFREVFPFSTL